MTMSLHRAIVVRILRALHTTLGRWLAQVDQPVSRKERVFILRLRSGRA